MTDETPSIEYQTYELANAVGWALSTWTIIETNLTELFLILSDMVDLNKAHLVMEAVVSFDGRLKIVGNLMELVKWRGDEGEMWGLLVSRIQRLQARRNELAHFQFVNVGEQAGTTPYVVPYFSHGAAMRGTIKKVTKDEIWDREKRFRAYAVALGWFGEQLSEMKGIPVANPRPESDLVQELRRSVVQSRADKQRHAPSSPQ